MNRLLFARLLLGLEYGALFVALPLLYAAGRVPLPLFPALWLLALICLLVLLASRDFDRTQLWNAHRFGRRALRATLPFVLAVPVLLAATFVFERDLLFRFVRERPLIWALVMVLYPILSAYPQGLVYRAFIFQRYRRLLPGRWTRILASAAAFSLVHLVFHNWVAPLLSLAGGLLFAWTYERTSSSLVATFQHALFGCWLFTVGLGWYFYHGAVPAP